MLERQISKDRLIVALTPTVGENMAVKCADIVISMGYRRIKYGTWIRDEEYVSDKKARFYCSRCGRWNVVKKRNEDVMLSGLRYCNGCGARMLAMK